ncbi:MAG: 16S rRNA (adenine(1518)-N(6)/adenine(1519)-N(6))-dimethyltransferase RsmA [Candidatus Paceibacterota bacterium]
MKPNKFLGQNFLNSKKIIADIMKTADLKPDDIILEVGPGKGILTEALLKAVPRGRVIAIEKDERLADYLNEKFKSIPKSSDRRKVGYSNLEIINGDILKFTDYSMLTTDYKIVANIPYYITSHFLRKFLEGDPSTSLGAKQPSRMVLMVQKEVAERMVARSTSLRAGKESILSISVKAYGEPKIIKKVPARYFSPAPKVDSAILLVNNISKNFFKDIDEKFFFNLVKQGFSQKRKMLKNNLKMLNTECSTKCGIKENARAEELGLENWKCLVKLV